MLNSEIKYLPLGDSYTIGESVDENFRWTNLLIKDLINSGVQIRIVENPAVTGYTTTDLIEKQLPVFRKMRPEFSSLLIGVNDWVQEVSTGKFRDNFRFILSEMLLILGGAEKMFTISIPDFSKTPEGYKYSKGRCINSGLIEFNRIINEESEKMNIAFVDIFDISIQAELIPELTANDGLHPSAIQYELWARRIIPVAKDLVASLTKS